MLNILEVKEQKKVFAAFLRSNAKIDVLARSEVSNSNFVENRYFISESYQYILDQS